VGFLGVVTGCVLYRGFSCFVYVLWWLVQSVSGRAWIIGGCCGRRFYPYFTL